MDIAAEGDDAWTVELDRGRLPEIERDVERLGQAEGIDMVLDVILVGKPHGASHRDHGDHRQELATPLNDFPLQRSPRILSARLLRPDNGALDGAAGLVLHQDTQVHPKRLEAHRPKGYRDKPRATQSGAGASPGETRSKI